MCGKKLISRVFLAYSDHRGFVSPPAFYYRGFVPPTANLTPGILPPARFKGPSRGHHHRARHVSKNFKNIFGKIPKTSFILKFSTRRKNQENFFRERELERRHARKQENYQRCETDQTQTRSNTRPGRQATRC